VTGGDPARPPPPPGPSPGLCSAAYWVGRYRKSTLQKFVKGEGLSSADADSAVNTLYDLHTGTLSPVFSTVESTP
jgi:hypothetical protein